MTPDQIQRLVTLLGGPKMQFVVEYRVHPQTLAGIRQRFARLAGPPEPGALYVGLRLTADPSIGIGWMHEHDGQGNLIRRIPPIGTQRRASN